MSLRLLLPLLLLSLPLSAAQPLRVDAAFWSEPRSGARVAAIEGLAERVAELDAGGRLVIAHPGGEEGELWAQELRGWLVALGVASAQIELRRIAQPGDGLQLFIESTTGHNNE